MPINKSTEYGNIEISLDAIANLAGGAITECYGIVGMASQKTLKDGWPSTISTAISEKGNTSIFIHAILYNSLST